MIKIGILSLPLNWNYGGILQQYALSKYLRKKLYTNFIFKKGFKKIIFSLILVKLKWKFIKILNKINFLHCFPLIATESFKMRFLTNKLKIFLVVKKLVIM